jgi:recombination associated protein RdgC
VPGRLTLAGRSTILRAPMPLQRGSATFSRFTVEPPSGDARRWLGRGLARGAFEPLDPGRSEEDRSAGFVEREDHDATGFANGAVLVGEWALFTWRVDAVAVRASAIKAELARWETLQAAKGGRPPSKAARAEARDAIRRELRRRTPVSTRTFDVGWNLESDELLAWAGSRKVVEEVAAAIEGAFEARLTPCTTAALATRGGGSLEGLSPTPALVGRPGDAEVAP